MKAAPVLITGVGQRVGLSLAWHFLERGMPVIGTYRTERDSIAELRAAGAELHRCDFYDEQQVTALIDHLQGRHSVLRAIIHNASEWLPDSGEYDPAETLRRMMLVHVATPYRLNLALQARLEASPDGADIIHLGDYVSARGSSKHIAYAASKAAQDNLTMSFAARLAPRVKVNSIAPALLLFNEKDDAEYRQRALTKSLMRREAGLEELLQAVDYLMASRYVTGRILPLDGGRHLVAA
jgi:dihydromonapterin reductase/dihydrofolate reductase